MRKLRNYIAWADTGRDFIDFEFSSEHRSGSKANFQDAKDTYKRKHGYRENIKILNTSLLD